MFRRLGSKCPHFFFCALAVLVLWNTPATATTLSELCASFGEYSDAIVTNRDRGILPTQSMGVIDKHAKQYKRTPEDLAFLRWIVLSVYKYNAFDAPRLRQMVEVECFERF